MCNLYKLGTMPAEVAKWFNAADSLSGANFGVEVYPGYPGAVVADGELKQMTWGFPLVQKSKKTGNSLKPKPVNNARSDKLDSFMWRFSFQERRCLIPLNAWAEAEGAKGKKVRTWLSLPNTELFAVAGIWRAFDEWGECYSMVMTDSAGAAAQVHSRMPVILEPKQFALWQNGSHLEARHLCQPYKGDVQIDRTEQLWTQRG
ncbi:SOS response-associated peptidase family protein [Erythrobacter sp. F6033]|uniref:SOS response-associated peptidase n=1 Tax=Erythrobacter sp. F6033 TaxID=2926401 RepID=UPI001FF40652|nr:SOS response-associated peptidase family protein [Erythrobacter sp. F6033]MCK0127527.1 SOS response-associated peptidase family protein [Erythrobacter sp. F6033]